MLILLHLSYRLSNAIKSISFMSYPDPAHSSYFNPYFQHIYTKFWMSIIFVLTTLCHHDFLLFMILHTINMPIQQMLKSHLREITQEKKTQERIPSWVTQASPYHSQSIYNTQPK